MKTRNKIFIGGIIGILIVLNSCNFNPNAGISDETPTRGKIKIGVDESFTQLMDAELYTFQAIYKYAHITPFYKPELAVLDDFINDSIRLMVTSRKLTKEEEQYLNSKQIVPRTTTIAYDAVAFIVNSQNPDTLIQFDVVKKILTGKITKWNQINAKNNAGNMKVVFDNNKSANVRYLREKFNIKENFPKYCYAVDKNEEVINYVEKTKNALGIISVNWISDKDDSLTHAFLKKIKVVGFTSEFDPEGYDYYKPYQAYIADKSYPFIREVYMINRETFYGLGTGFISFVAGDQGQRIVLKGGMVPATMPVRLIQMKSN